MKINFKLISCVYFGNPTLKCRELSNWWLPSMIGVITRKVLNVDKTTCQIELMLIILILM